jgi:hypothetical protein
MTQAKKELLPSNKLHLAAITQISSFLPLTLCRASRDSYEQRNLLLSSLARYAAAGKVAQVERLATLRPELQTQVLFSLAGLGAQDEMEPILKQRPEDLLAYRPLRDISGAQFSHISLFQHAIWTKDVRYMANMMLDCLPQNEQGEAIRLEMVRQYEELMDQGVEYQLNGVLHQGERHFSLQPLITALETYVTEYNNWTDEQRKKHWCTVVGLAQTVLPAHIRHHYCDPEESFCDKPNFKKPKLKRSLEIYNWVANKYQLWGQGLGGLGLDFGLRGGPPGRCVRPPAVAWPATVAVDSMALKALDEMRTSFDMLALIKRLYTPIKNLEENLTVHQDMKI